MRTSKAAAAVAFAASGLLLGGCIQGPWTQSRFDGGRTAFNSQEDQLGSANVSSFQMAWQSPTGTYRAPLADGLRVLTAGTQITAWEANLGTVLWHAPGNGAPLNEWAGVVQAANGHLISRDANNGSVVWSVPFAGTAVTLGDDLYGVEPFSGGTRVRAFQPLNGVAEWSTTIGSAAANTPAVAGNDVVVIDRAGVVHDLTAAGHPRWTHATVLRTVGSPVLAHGSVFVAGETAAGVPEVIMLNKLTGAIRWSRSLATSERVQTNMAVDGDTLYLATTTHLRAYDLSGNARWSRALANPSAPAVGQNDVFVTANQRLVALDVANGATVFTSSDLGAGLSGPVDADGSVYVAGSRLYAFRPTWIVAPQEAEDFGKVSIDAESTPHSVSFTNKTDTASGPLTLALTGADSTFFHLANDSCDAGVDPASTCSVDVSFAPITTRAYSAALILTHGATTLVTEPLRGRGSAITLTTDGSDFGSWFYGTSSPVHHFTLTNTGPRPRHLGIDQMPDDDTARANWIMANRCAAVIEPGATCAIDVTFSSRIVHRPPDVQPATLYVCDIDRLCEIVARADLTATGLPVVAVAGETNFGNVTIGASVSHTFTVTNLSPTATGPLTISVFVYAEGDSAITANNCDGVSVATAASCTVDVTMTPPGSGTYAVFLFVSSSITLASGVNLTVTGVAQ
jgi:hypothetical protein